MAGCIMILDCRGHSPVDLLHPPLLGCNMHVGPTLERFWQDSVRTLRGLEKRPRRLPMEAGAKPSPNARSQGSYLLLTYLPFLASYLTILFVPTIPRAPRTPPSSVPNLPRSCHATLYSCSTRLPQTIRRERSPRRLASPLRTMSS